MAYVYVVTEVENHKLSNRIKIGFTGSSLEARIQQLQTGNPSRLIYLWTLCVRDAETARMIERLTHKELEEYRLEGEWFESSTHSKSFFLNTWNKLGGLLPGTPLECWGF